jgi:hypothetical protein
MARQNELSAGIAIIQGPVDNRKAVLPSPHFLLLFFVTILLLELRLYRSDCRRCLREFCHVYNFDITFGPRSM